jgi:hypothetical protein
MIRKATGSAGMMVVTVLGLVNKNPSAEDNQATAPKTKGRHLESSKERHGIPMALSARGFSGSVLELPRWSCVRPTILMI